jgi:hypothetical protein
MKSGFRAGILMPLWLPLICLVVFMISSCSSFSDKVSGEEHKIFKLSKAARTGIKFSNDIEESHELNVITYADFYSGGGVGIGDINNDSLPDVVLTGNMVQYRLYLNKGNLKFEDITEKAGLTAKGEGWYTGVAMADVNGDGFLDFYISKSGMHEPYDRRNLLFINNGDLTFSEKAKSWGVDHAGYAVNSTFFDFDKDGDLDMFLVNQGPEKFSQGIPDNLRAEVHEYCGDRLYENIGNRFIDITLEAGIWSSVIGFGHGVSVGDLNSDGWEDIFVSNDFFERDYVYLNNGDKTFTENVRESMKHISYYSMGNDMADFNNDGFLDIMVVDMVAEDHRRLKSNLGGMKPSRFWYSVENGLHYQYMYNMLQLNNGDGTFREIGQMAGISNTDWSWGPIFADFNNDGRKDIFVSNGLRKDIRNIDHAQAYHKLQVYSYNIFTSDQWDFLLNTMPSEKIRNYMYMNNGDLTFTNVAEAWGLGQPTFSNGAAYGDLDNDGDLELIVNNVDEDVFLYENLSEQFEGHEFLKIKFRGPRMNQMGIGTKVQIEHGENFQVQQLYLTRGYRSSMDPVLIFGLGSDSIVDRLKVEWYDGKSQILQNIVSNQEIILSYSDASSTSPGDSGIKTKVFEDVTDKLDVQYKHVENIFDDYRREALLPYKMSALGPNIDVADVNGDGLDDFHIGGSFRHPGHLYLQDKEGGFLEKPNPLWKADRLYEDSGILFFDSDSDGDQDLYITSGGSEYEDGDPSLQDRLYVNDGKGNFSRKEDALPEIRTSGSKAVPCDFDQDGDLDLFVGGRMIPGRYPQPADSYLLKNEGGTFIDVTDQAAPDLRKAGMVTSALWMDYDGDQDDDLIIAGEWMPILVLENINNRFNKVNTANGLENSTGWWFSLGKGDFDNDGDLDLIAGNLGLNYVYKATETEPFEVYSDDFNEDGRLDIIMGYYNGGVLYPVHGKNRLAQQIPHIDSVFLTFDEFSLASLEDIFTKEALDSALNYKVRTFATSYIENLGNGQFDLKPLGGNCQLAPTNAIIVSDINHDSHLDLILAGNLYGSEIEIIRADAGTGVYLVGDGHGNFEQVANIDCGMRIDGDVKDMKMVNTSEGSLLIAVRNSDTLKATKIVKRNQGQ